MRPGQNRRMRNRNRKPPNPLTKTFESNGPDVKVRGTAQHIAEKYVQLARDSHASGNPVAAENYLQHAEHYLRIILSAQSQYPQSFSARSFDDEQDDGDEGFDYGVQGYGAPQPEGRFSAHDEESQPVIQPRERTERHSRSHDRYERQERQERPERMERMERPERSERMERPERSERMDRSERPERMDRRDRFRRRREDMGGMNQQPVHDDAAASHHSTLPAFLTTPIRTLPENDEQPVRPLTHDLEAGNVNAPPRMHSISVEANDLDDADKPAPRTRRRRAPVEEVVGEATADVAPVRKLRATRTRRKSVDDVPVAE